jgi:hypothetical protein
VFSVARSRISDYALYRLRCGDLLAPYSLATMNAMWIDQAVDATVEFPRGLTFPRLRAIRFRDEEVQFAGPVQVERTPSALLYRMSAGPREYTVCFEPAQQRGILELVQRSSTLL